MNKHKYASVVIFHEIPLSRQIKYYLLLSTNGNSLCVLMNSHSRCVLMVIIYYE